MSNLNWSGLMQVGHKQYHLGNYQQARIEFSKAARLMPDKYESWLNLSTTFLALGVVDKAVTCIKNALIINPSSTSALLVKGDCFRFLGDLDQAIECYEQSLKINKEPLILNRLGCAVREKKTSQLDLRRLERAKEIFLEALELDPEFNVAKYNAVVTCIILNQIEDAKPLYNTLSVERLPPKDVALVSELSRAFDEYDRLQKSLDEARAIASPHPIDLALSSSNSYFNKVDEELLVTVAKIGEAANNIGNVSVKLVQDLSDEWSRIEALHMIPYVSGVDEYVESKLRHDHLIESDQDYIESLAMVEAIEHAREHKERMSTPIHAESNFRFWHILSVKDFPQFLQGHFKLLPNELTDDPSKERTRVDAVPQTIERFFREVYPNLNPGLARAIVALYFTVEIHAFKDGNGRVGLNWMNRELEWAGLMPAIFSREMGLRGSLREARIALREDPSNINPMLETILAGQEMSAIFLKQLKEQ